MRAGCSNVRINQRLEANMTPAQRLVQESLSSSKFESRLRARCKNGQQLQLSDRRGKHSTIKHTTKHFDNVCCLSIANQCWCSWHVTHKRKERNQLVPHTSSAKVSACNSTATGQETGCCYGVQGSTCRCGCCATLLQLCTWTHSTQ